MKAVETGVLTVSRRNLCASDSVRTALRVPADDFLETIRVLTQFGCSQKRCKASDSSRLTWDRLHSLRVITWSVGAHLVSPSGLMGTLCPVHSSPSREGWTQGFGSRLRQCQKLAIVAMAPYMTVKIAFAGAQGFRASKSVGQRPPGLLYNCVDRRSCFGIWIRLRGTPGTR